MKISTTASIIASLFSTLTAAGQIEFYSAGGCSGGGEIYYPSSTGYSCEEISGYDSAMGQQVDGGCSFTVYTDSQCSDNPTLVGLGQCVQPGSEIYSYSYDC